MRRWLFPALGGARSMSPARASRGMKLRPSLLPQARSTSTASSSDARAAARARARPRSRRARARRRRAPRAAAARTPARARAPTTTPRAPPALWGERASVAAARGRRAADRPARGWLRVPEGAAASALRRRRRRARRPHAPSRARAGTSSRRAPLPPSRPRRARERRGRAADDDAVFARPAEGAAGGARASCSATRWSPARDAHGGVNDKFAGAGRRADRYAELFDAAPGGPEGAEARRPPARAARRACRTPTAARPSPAARSSRPRRASRTTCARGASSRSRSPSSPSSARGARTARSRRRDPPGQQVLCSLDLCKSVLSNALSSC